MPTGEEQAIQKQVMRDLQEGGVAWAFVGEWPEKATYYKADGTPMPNLPADPWSMRRYLARGFTLAPPQNPTATVGVAGTAGNGKLVCDVCGKGPFKIALGLAGHKRSHKKE